MFIMPFTTASYIIGNITNKDTNIGTKLLLNHNTAIKIRGIVGIVLIKFMIGIKIYLTLLNIPAIIPNVIARKNERTKVTITLIKVYNKLE